jgi:multisubunit Na+/H+ antiporter MnhG subunit
MKYIKSFFVNLGLMLAVIGVICFVAGTSLFAGTLVQTYTRFQHAGPFVTLGCLLIWLAVATTYIEKAL